MTIQWNRDHGMSCMRAGIRLLTGLVLDLGSGHLSLPGSATTDRHRSTDGARRTPRAPKELIDHIRSGRTPRPAHDSATTRRRVGDDDPTTTRRSATSGSTSESTETFLRGYLAEFRDHVERVLTVLPRP